MKKFSRVTAIIIFCAVSASVLTTVSPLSGEYRFREFRDDRNRFERYAEEAEKELSAEEWQSILDSGREEMRASWEKGADEEVRRYLREGGDEDEIRGTLEEARAQWERDFNAEQAMAKGAWYFQREALTSPAVSLQGLKNRVGEANSDSSIESIEDWDAYVKSALDSVNSSWSTEFNSLIDAARLKGASITNVKEREAFEQELAAFEKELKGKFSLERDSVLYLGRNSFIAERYTDTDSLRRKSEAESAEAITEEVIKGVENEISKEEDKILSRSFSGDGSESINFSSMGDNWQEELKKLIETGMGKWNAAREKLYNEMLSWKNTAQEAFENIEAKWRLALEKLEKAKGEWEQKLSGEIFQGLADWQKERTDLEKNIADARRDLSGYMENMSSQWEDHSQSLVDMAVNGSRVYKEALDNIKWLEGMAGKYNRQPAFTVYNENFKKILADDPVSSGLEAIKAEMKSYGYITEEGISIKPVLLDITYDKNTGVFTEKYRLDICYKFPPCEWFPYGLEWPYKSLNWDNVVTSDTKEESRKSTYYYYLSELKRWENIRDSFSTIARDSEFYMHEKNMLGQSGPGYLTNNSGEYGPNDTGHDGDPYLMTGTEYDLELAKRDREFWQKRLDIAKAVLDYAETAKKEGAVVTEKRKADAEVAMNEAKSAYETALKKVEDIVRDLKNKQQCEKPADNYDPQNVTPEWKAYLESIDYLTNEFTEANRALALIEGKYEERRRTIIIMENGENAEYLKKEIEDIGINILNADRQLFEKRTELYRIQREGEYAERSAGFAQRYEEAVRNYEDSKWRLGEFNSIVSGPENDENVEKWINSITSENIRNKIWKSNANEQASFLKTLYNDYINADQELKDQKREKLTFYLRGIYSSLQLSEKRDLKIIGILRNNSFNSDQFLKTGYSVNHSVYKKYADISVNALNIIKDAFEWSMTDDNRKNYNSLVSYIRDISADIRYTYGADNSKYIAHYTALKIFEDRYRGLTPETWGSSRERLDGDILYSEKASDLHEEISGMDSAALAELAANHEANATSQYNMNSVAWLREYYLTGSGITGLEFILSIDREGEIEKIIQSEAENYVIENGRYFSREQELLKTHNYLDDVLGFIQNKVSIAAGGGEEGLSMDMLKTLSPEKMSIAAGALREYADNLEKNGITVPDFIRSAVYTLAQLKNKLDSELFILSWMRGSNGMEGSPEEILEKKTAEYNVSASVMNFLKTCGSFLDSGADDVSASIAILNCYEGLDDASRKFLNDTDNAGLQKIKNFIASLYSSRSELLIYRLASDYEKTDTSTTPEQYVSLIQGLTDSEKASLVFQLKPLYERRLYDRDYADGKISSIDMYITSRGLPSDDEILLRNYALISEYNRILNSTPGTSGTSDFKDYTLFRDFEKKTVAIERKIGESDSEYASRCVEVFISDKGIADQGVIERLETFAEKFIDGELSSIVYLPHEVQIFTASQYYYEEIYLKNRVLNTGISDFLEERFGTGSVDNTVEDAVEKYAARLNGAALYYGQDFESYLSGISPGTKDYFLMYVYGERSAMLPGFEYGLYGNSSFINGMGLAVQGALGRKLDSFYRELGGLSAEQGRFCDEAEAALKHAEALKQFIAAGGDNQGWRGSMTGITEPGEENKPLIIKEEVSEQTGWIDYSDSEGGINNHIRYAGEIRKDEVTYSLNSIVDSVNSIYSIYNSLGKIMPVEAASGWSGGIGEFLNNADTVYGTGGDYTRNESGVFSFESAMRDISAGFEARASDFSATENTLAGEINSREAALWGSYDTLVSKRKSYDLFGGGDQKTQLEELGKLRIEHEAAKRRVEEFSQRLTTARTEYENLNSTYVNQMNLISRTYADYKELESAYEKAYAVWEYANTPYLKEMEKNDGGIISGELPGEENIGDYTKIDIPDARENYLRIEKKFNESDSEYNKKAEAVAKQETVGKLNEDTEYTKLKEDFKRKSETYIRVSQADAQLGEKLAQFETDYNQSKKSFDISRDAVKFYNDAVKNLSEEQKEVLRKERDVILSHVAKYGVSTYMNAMAWYSSYRAITGGAGGSHYHANISQYYSYISLHTDIKRDMEILNNSFRNDNTSFDTLVDNYHIYKYYEREADSAWRHYRHTSKARYFTRRERKREAEKLSNKCNNYYSSYYYSGSDPIKKTLTDYVKKRNDLNEKTEVLNGISSVKDLSVLKEYIGTGTMYNLSSEDLSHLYDSTSDGFIVTEESINLNSLRKEVKRTDLDGDAVKAVYRNGKVIVLGKDGKELTDAVNIYSITNPGISLKLDGESIETFEEGKIYELYDRNFNIKGVTAVMKDLAKQKRDEYYNDLMVYVQKSAAEGKHDYTIMLRDLESTFHGLQQYAVNFNFDQSKAESEKRQRGFDGYAAVTKEYVNNGRGTSIQDLIVKELMRQNMGYQEKVWAQQMEKFNERETRWREVTGYILNRGNRDWRIKYGEFLNQWNKWRFETKKEIEEGEKWWTDRDADMQQEIKQWGEDTGKASSKAAAEKIYSELAGKIESYEKNLKKNMPGKDFNIDTDKILANTMRSLPVDSIDILGRSMFSTDTTAGLAEMLNLGLSSSLYKYNEQKMTEYQEAVGMMKNLQVIDILNGIIENFNKQLLEANESVYESFGGFATGQDMINAPWVRSKDESLWSIRVCVESTLMGDKYKTRRFKDYNYYLNRTVFLQPLKGLNGTTIDFTNAGSYAKLDGDELETYVGLESEFLTRKIEEVFKNPDEAGNGGGLFSGHVNGEQERLGEEFKNKYIEWLEGEAMKGLAAWNKPIGHGAPSIAVTVNIGAQAAGGAVGFVMGGSAGAQLGAAIGQFAASTVFTSLDIADNTVSWQHAGAQMGTGFLNSAAGMFSPLSGGAMRGIEYKDGGGLGWSQKDFEAGIKSGAKEMLIRNMTGNVAGLSDIAASWVDTEGGWGDWGFDNSHWSDHIMAGVGGAIGTQSGKLPGQSGEGITELLRFTAYHALDGKGFENRAGVNEGQYNWNLFKPDASHMGSSLFKVAQLLGQRMNQQPKDGEKPGLPSPDTRDPWQEAETGTGGWWLSNRRWDENVSDIFGRIAGNISESYNEGGIDGVLLDGISAYAGFIGSSAVSEFNETVQGWFDAASGFGRIGNAIGNAWSSVVESVGGWFGGNKQENTIKPIDSAIPNSLYTSEEIAAMEKKYTEQMKWREIEAEMAKINNGLKTADDPVLREKAMKEYREAAKNIKQNENGIWEMEIGGAKIEFNGTAVETARNNGMTMQQYAGCLDEGMVYMINDMVRDLNIKTITVSATYYNNPKAPAGHDKGLSIDITEIKFNDGKAPVLFDNRETKIGESPSAAIVFTWLIKRSEVLDVYNPWQMMRGSANKWDPYPNEWISENKKLTEYNRMWQHRNHMHIRLRDYWRNR